MRKLVQQSYSYTQSKQVEHIFKQLFITLFPN